MRSRAWRLVLGALAFTVSCQGLLGIEDRTFEPLGADGGGGSSGAPSAQCSDYCTLVLENCTTGNVVYKSLEACLAVCALLPPGKSDDETGNSVACRIKQAALANTTGEPDSHCPSAGPGGGKTCGGTCEGYCSLFMLACPGKILEKDTCLAACDVLPQAAGFDIVENYSENSVQCRIVHLANAALDPAGADSVHCGHSAIFSQCPCCDPDAGGVLPDCETYCGLVMSACQGPQVQYETVAQCVTACAAFDLGVPTDPTTLNTVACRMYHSNSSLAAPETHCSHAGPSGDGHCGTSNCDGYCTLMEAFCPGRFADKTACGTECGRLVGSNADDGYGLDTIVEGDNVQCRIREAVKAAASPGDNTLCDRAAGVTLCK